MEGTSDLFRWIVQSTSDGIWIFDAEGRTTYANDRLGQMLGRTPEEMSGLSVFDTLDEVGQAQFRDHLAELAELADGQGGADNVECSLLRGDGTRIWVLVSHTPLLDDDGVSQGWLHRLTELGDRERLRARVSASERQFAEAQSIARVGSWEWDVPANVVTWSDEHYRIFDVDPEDFEPTYEGFRACLHPEDAPRVDAAIAAAFEEGDSYGFEVRVIKRDGDETWIRAFGRVARDAEGTPVRVTGTSHDITDSIRTAAALAAASARLEVLQTITAAANEATSLNEAVDVAATELARHTGWRVRAAYAVAENGGLKVMDGAGAHGLSAAAAAPAHWVRQAVADQEITWGPEATSDKAGDPETGMMAVIALPVAIDGTVVCVLEVVPDVRLEPKPEVLATFRQVASQLGQVAQRERSARELAAARDAATEASRMKSEFLATMSHEIRTPLNGVIGLSGLLLGTGLDDRQRRLTDGIDQAGRALLELVADILDLSKIEAGKLELEVVDFDVREVVEQVTALMAEPARQKSIELMAACHPEVPTVLRGDPVRFRQVLTNLVSNAVKFTAEGEVVVRVTAGEQREGRSALRVEVSDTGVGIAPETQERLFDAFTQADASTTREYGGTGLGLAISHRLVQALGGEVGVTSEVGKGSTFWFTAPFDAGRTAPVTGGEAVASLAGLRALVVDDNETSRAILREQLTAGGMTVVTADSADEALAAMSTAARSHQPFEMLLVDLSAPESDGLGLAESVRCDPSLRDVQLVLLTSVAEVGHEALSRLKVDVCLDKPVPYSTLLSRLARSVGGEAGQNDGAPPQQPASGDARVLVVDDNPINQMVAVGMLESLGYRTVIARDGVEALETLDASRDYVAVLMDCRMPRLDGYDATRAIRDQEGSGHRIPIIAMTATAVAGERERCLAAGMDDFITKPVSLEVLTAALGQWTACPAHRKPVADPEHDEVDGVLDDDRIATLVSLKPGDQTLVNRLVDAFLEGADEDRAEILKAVSAADPTLLVEAAHRLKGGARSIGVPRVGEVCQRLEHAGAVGDFREANSLGQELTREIDRAVTALLALRARNG